MVDCLSRGVMGIIDFREIVSPKADHVSSKDAPIGKSNLTDDFEVFCQEFFRDVRKLEIFKTVSRGADGGIDLGVKEVLPDGSDFRWLVSCKHNAHSGKAVSDSEEKNIMERVGYWRCDGFIPFYTTIPTATVSNCIAGIERLGKKVEKYFKDRIEEELLSSPEGMRLAARYFPQSLVNHYAKIIETSRRYNEEDIFVQDHILYSPNGIQQSVKGASEAELAYAKKRIVHVANIFATMDMHALYFVRALNEAIELAPAHFHVNGPAVRLEDFVGVSPTWSDAELARASAREGLMFMYFVASVWSFWDWNAANDVFARAMVIRSRLGEACSDSEVEDLKNSPDFSIMVDGKKGLGLLAPGLVALKLQEKLRDVLVRLMAFANPIPQRGGDTVE